MGLTIGPASWHPANIGPVPLGSSIWGGRLFCKSLGIAWIVAPASTQVSATWNGTTNTLVGNKPCVSDWPSLCTALINAGLNPSQWFVPTNTELQSAYTCRTFWDYSTANYWSSCESDTFGAWQWTGSLASLNTNSKSCATNVVRAFRCVTY